MAKMPFQVPGGTGIDLKDSLKPPSSVLFHDIGGGRYGYAITDENLVASRYRLKYSYYV